ncbi:hypothetical protein [Curtobacterium sp. PhB191]|uniref:hypothetical protein n=1 Tax=Curtobacterium sp. PhB191 TaxID=2485202 RepID=UPI00104B376B|nr:hypothetical protein [Curtobacterium sp. PhB191]
MEEKEPRDRTIDESLVSLACLGALGLGVMIVGGPDIAWWDVGSTLLVLGAFGLLALLLASRRSAVPMTLRVRRANWLGAAIGLGAGALVGTAVSGGSTALAALLPVPLVAIDAVVSRSGGGLRARSIVLGLTAALIAVVLFWNSDVRQGFSDLVQGSVVAGVLLAVGLGVWGVVRRQRA